MPFDFYFVIVRFQSSLIERAKDAEKRAESASADARYERASKDAAIARIEETLRKERAEHMVILDKYYRLKNDTVGHGQRQLQLEENARLKRQVDELSALNRSLADVSSSVRTTPGTYDALLAVAELMGGVSRHVDAGVVLPDLRQRVDELVRRALAGAGLSALELARHQSAAFGPLAAVLPRRTRGRWTLRCRRPGSGGSVDYCDLGGP